MDTKTLLSEQRTRYHLEAKTAVDGLPIILSANVTRGLGRKMSLSATLKNVFRETASLSGAYFKHWIFSVTVTNPYVTQVNWKYLSSVSLERRRDSSGRQYSVEVELLLPEVVGSRMLGLMEQKGSVWSSALRLKYGLGGKANWQRQTGYAQQTQTDSEFVFVFLNIQSLRKKIVEHLVDVLVI